MSNLNLNVEIIEKSGLFDESWYLSEYCDVSSIGLAPLSHFLKYGTLLGRNPGPGFNTNYYLSSNPDVKLSGINPLLHYIKHGKSEGRKSYPSLRNKKSLTHPKIQQNITKDGIVEPIVTDYWDNNISIISCLRKSNHKFIDTTVPSEIVKLSESFLEILAPSISVIMPTWNRENSICKAIDSILAQSYQPLEIIIIDDGSTDDTLELLHKQYKNQLAKQQIKIIRNQHSGVSAARNVGLENSQGDLIAYLDSDNIWRSDYLLVMASCFSENDELNCAYSALKIIDKNNASKESFLSTKYDRNRLLDVNFIDLNVFVHRRLLYDQFGGFDTQLKRLVDWELIIRYTKSYLPAFIPFVGVDYFLDNVNLKNITTTVGLDDNLQRVYDKHFFERIQHGLENIRLAYVLWDFPALSQTFVIEEIKWLKENGHDVIVYYSIEPDKSAVLDFEIESHRVKDASELASLLLKHNRNLCHSHFAYPTVTLLTYPACVETNLPFTFMPHAVDIFHHKNKERNNIGSISKNPLCKKIFVHGEFHKAFIENCGVESKKIAFNFQAVNISYLERHSPREQRLEVKKHVYRGVIISRFVEKKGLNSLIESASLLTDENVTFDIYGYGPLEESYKKQIFDLKLNNISIKGPLHTQQEVIDTYLKSDFLIAPCDVSENGDMDGFPTVILEAIGVGLPVITTDIAAIPDYLTDGVDALIAPAGDIHQIADRVRMLIKMPPERKRAMVKRSQQFLDEKIGVKKTMQMLLDTWRSYTIDIFLVTFDTNEYSDRKETFEIIKRIFKYTTTSFTLTIVDNNSDTSFWNELICQVKGYSNVRLIRKYKNQYGGPGSNIAMEFSNSEYAIYICSKEGFIKKHGWERPLLEHMRKNPNNVMAGHLSQLPGYIYGKEYTKLPDFPKFRNRKFASKNPNRVFKHVQGGAYIISKKFIDDHGGFNPDIPQGGMDIELSYYIESLGYSLGEIPEVASSTVKTLPKLPTILSERTVIAHPLTTHSVVKDLDTLERSNGRRCNICGWKGQNFEFTSEKGSLRYQCPDCRSTGFGRSILKLLANNHHIYRGESCVILSDDTSLKKSLNRLFEPLTILEDSELFLSTLRNTQNLVDCIIVDPKLIKEKNASEIWQQMIKFLSPQGELIFADSLFLDHEFIKDASNSANKSIQNALSTLRGRYSIKYIDITSYCTGYDWRRFGSLRQSLRLPDEIYSKESENIYNDEYNNKSLCSIRIAVAVHVYYLDMIPEILEYIFNIPYDYNLYFTVSKESSDDLIKILEIHNISKYELIIYPNQGYDIAPFLHLLSVLKEQNYELVCKIHTKKGPTHLDIFSHWFDGIVKPILGSTMTVKNIITAFSENSTLGIVGSADFYKSAQKLMYGNEEPVTEILSTIDNEFDSTQEWGFFAGTIFWARIELFDRLQENQALDKLIQKNIAIEMDPGAPASIFHSIERVLGALPKIGNMTTGISHRAGDTQDSYAIQLLLDDYNSPSSKNILETLIDIVGDKDQLDDANVKD
jgi:glycosyltransferase involved in cell wall biosynthesis